MSPKEKAEELVDRIEIAIDDSVNSDTYVGGKRLAALRCALIAMDEILSEVTSIHIEADEFNYDLSPTVEYWQKVKTEIENL